MTDSEILVTGGSSGIGAAIVSAIASTGRRVGVVSRRSPPVASDLDTDLGTHPSRQALLDWIQADLADAAATASAIGAWRRGARGPLDGVVLSAVSYGHGSRHPVAETSLHEWDQLMAVNLRAQFVVVSTVLAELISRPKAMIVSVSSIAAMQAAPGRAHYAASKAGSLAFFRALAPELAGTGISVVQIMPKQQVATPGLAARRPAGFSFAGYACPAIFGAFVRAILPDLGESLNGSLVVIDSDGNWELHPWPETRIDGN